METHSSVDRHPGEGRGPVPSPPPLPHVGREEPLAQAWIKVEQLSGGLAYIKGPVTDSVTRDISRLDAQAAETRARRQALEARLQSLEAAQGGAIAP